MPTLAISLDDSTQRAVLQYPSRDGTWESLRRVCEEVSDDVAIAGQSLSLPWFSFVAIRRAIAYRLQADGASLTFDSRSRGLLSAIVARERMIERASSIQPLDQGVVLSTIESLLHHRTLKNYQLANVSVLARFDVGATFSVPGAGKTTEALAFFGMRMTEQSQLLVVAPKNAFAAWEEQLAFWRFSVPFVRLTGGQAAIRLLLDRRPRFSLITYQQLPNARRHVAHHLSRSDSFLFLDESHKIKGGADRITARTVLELQHLARGRLIMSGTPLPNSTSDLLTQVKFLTPEADVDATNVVDFIQPLYVRTTKKDLDLPPLNRRLVPIAMRPSQDRMYRLLKSEVARQADPKVGVGDRQRLRRLGRSALSLIQFTSNPALLLKRGTQFSDLLSDVLDEGDAPKLEFACDRARQLADENRKVIIWSSFVENVEIISQRLSDLGADFIHGGVEAGSEQAEDTREAKIRRFHDDPSAMVLVANPAAASEGISLHTVCQNAIYVDRNYNAAQYLQSEDRIHRIGSTSPCFVDILYSPSTVDETVAIRLGQKISVMADVLRDESLRVSPVTLDLDALGFDSADASALLDHLASPDTYNGE